MKKLFLLAILLTMAFSVFAQKQKSKEDLIKEIGTLTNSKKPEDLEKGYLLCKDFLKRFGTDTDDPVVRIKTFVGQYQNNKFLKAIGASQYADAFALGNEILAEQPDNIDVMINLAYAGYNARSSKNIATYVNDSIAFAGKSLQAMEAGNMPKSFTPFKDKDDAFAWLHFMKGALLTETDMKAAVGDLYKAIQYESSVKQSSVPYYMIASYYETVYEKLSTDLKAKSPRESDFKEVTDATGRSLDRMLDAYARACNRAAAEKSPNAAQWRTRLVQVYTYRKRSDAGLDDFINNAMSTPLPDPSKL